MVLNFKQYGKPTSVRNLGIRLHPIAGLIVLIAIFSLIILVDISIRYESLCLTFLCVFLAGVVMGGVAIGTSRAWCKEPTNDIE